MRKDEKILSDWEMDQLRETLSVKDFTIVSEKQNKLKNTKIARESSWLCEILKNIPEQDKIRILKKCYNEKVKV